MPIQVNFTDPQTNINVPASYWKISVYDINDDLNTWDVTYAGFKDLASKNQGYGSFTRAQRVFGKFSDLVGINNSSTWAQIKAAIDTFALNYTDPYTLTKPFNGGTIV